MTTPQTIEQHAERILRACHHDADYHIEFNTPERQAILTALTAYGVACAEAMREAAAGTTDAQVLRGEDAAYVTAYIEDSIRALAANAVIKGMGHG